MPGNSRSGKRRGPDALKIVQGTYRPDKSGSLDSKVNATGEPVMPDWLVGEARKHWEDVVPELIDMGIVKAIDTHMLACMCVWWQRFREATTKTALAESFYQWEKCARTFGMNPSDRSRLSVKPEGRKVRSRKSS